MKAPTVCATPSAPTAAPVAGRPYGVLGEKLGHSYTPVIYRELAGIDYHRFERAPENVEAFLNGGEWEGFNATIPYKRTVVPYLDELSPVADRLGNVNTVTRLANGRLRGDNTDYFGFESLVTSASIDLAERRVLVLGGDGGAGTTCMTVLADLGAEPVSVSRDPDAARAQQLATKVAPHPVIGYDEVASQSGVAAVVNCTPVGMYPACPASPLSDSAFDALVAQGLESVVDIVYNPARTGLMLQAENRGIASVGGLLMLVAQAAQAVERYLGSAVEAEEIARLTEHLSFSAQNIALIGMPGCGKTRVGEQLSRLTGRAHVDIDHVLERELGTTCQEFIQTQGEAAFRAEESRVLAEVASKSGQVISCGGGVVTVPGNRDLLRQNSLVVMLNRNLDELPVHGRPISARDGIALLAQRRMPLYRSWADIVVDSRENPRATAEALNKALPFQESLAGV